VKSSRIAAWAVCVVGVLVPWICAGMVVYALVFSGIEGPWILIAVAPPGLLGALGFIGLSVVGAWWPLDLIVGGANRCRSSVDKAETLLTKGGE